MNDSRPASPRAGWVTYGVAAAVFGVLDALWLTQVAARTYATQLAHLTAPQPNLVAALLFYVIFIAGLVHFVLRPGEGRSLGTTLRDAALFGLVTYATWDLTSAALFKDFPWSVVALDLAWGVGASTLATYLTRLILGRLKLA